MNKNNLPIRAIVIVVLLAAGAVLAWFNLQPAKTVILPPPTTVVTPEAGHALPKVITLYRKGEGESDLAVFVAKELAARNSGLAVFNSIDTSDEPQMLEYYGVSSVPAVIFIAPTGKIAHKHEGYLEKAAIIKLLRALK